jgi:hypothetical protein
MRDKRERPMRRQQRRSTKNLYCCRRLPSSNCGLRLENMPFLYRPHLIPFCLGDFVRRFVDAGAPRVVHDNLAYRMHQLREPKVPLGVKKYSVRIADQLTSMLVQYR